ncbi:hypothetical protein CEP51_013638 [Fusarium floridanum]|uniref:AAA+ ATPase domain-containing protein n=1 Tax=Fusarium floridanum TaxID=1325733 RepID=A0A428Q843_9HYPO|nr:hypothetical protein CEP51_013638 [Fusarium floridanum]
MSDPAVPPVGSECSIKKLFNHSTPGLKPRWSDFQDPVLEERRVKELGQAHFVIHRFSSHVTEGGAVAWSTHSIEVKSQHLRGVLDGIFHDYPKWSPDESPYTFSPPFTPLVHRWENFLKAYDQEKDQRVKMEMLLLREEIEPLLVVNFSALQEAKSSGTIAFDNLWLLLAPGDMFLLVVDGQQCIAKLLNARLIEADDYDYDSSHGGREENPYWQLTLGQTDWNGSYCGLKRSEVVIQEFEESKSISTLPACPLRFVPCELEKDLRQRIVSRGRKFESLRGFHVKDCDGGKVITIKDPYEREKEKVEPVRGRVIVDAFAFYHCQDDMPPTLLRGGNVTDDESESGDTEATSVVGDKAGNLTRHEDLSPLTDEQCLLAVPRVRGFDLETKKWCQFNIDDIRDPEWDNRPFDNLVLSDDKRELLVAFTAYNKSRESVFDDFVKRKGKGIVILLYGPPGVGKTLTAEAVAEKSKVPLYVMSAGELGRDPAELQDALRRALTCCQLWNAMLLLDEADVFMENRSSSNLQLNELVSIFLRQLEYYQGLLFLTTNRVSSIDPAFKSRLDLIMPYKELDWTARRKVWTNFISGLPQGAADLSEDDYDELAKKDMNGRDIKNVIKTGLILAGRDVPLTMRQLEIMLKLREEVAILDS